MSASSTAPFWQRAAVGALFTTVVSCVVLRAQKSAETQPPTSGEESSDEGSESGVIVPPSGDSGAPILLPSSKVGPLDFSDETPPINLEELLEEGAEVETEEADGDDDSTTPEDE